MAKKPLPKEGSQSAQELYHLVGAALSQWEASEDALMGLFSLLCGLNEPVAFKAYVNAPRNVRTSMLKFSMEIYESRFEKSEIKNITDAIAELEKLAKLRNEIAHGQVCHYTVHTDGEKSAHGHYLLPSQNENGPFERSHRFNHIAETISDFIKKTYELRWKVQNVSIAITLREQNEDQSAGIWISSQRQIAKLISARMIAAHEIEKYMKEPSNL